VKQSRTKCFW